MDAFESLHPVPAAWLHDSDLAPFASAYVSRLVDRGYATNTVRMYVYAVAHFARWFRRCPVGVPDLTDKVAQRFIDEHLPRCTCPSPVQRSTHQVRAALRHLLITLRDAGAIHGERNGPIEDELDRFDAHMHQARGLAKNTRIRRLSVVRALLQFRAAHGSEAMEAPSADELRRFIAQELSRISPASAGALASALRGYLRYRAFGGDPVGHLLPIIAAPAHWRLAPGAAAADALA
jgi:site-specific recombinase XerD